MSIQEIDLKVKELRELQAMVEEATAQIEAIKDSIKLKMVDEGTEVLQGNGWKATWHTVTSSRLDSKALKTAAPELYQRFTKTTSTTRFTLAREKPLPQQPTKAKGKEPNTHTTPGGQVNYSLPSPKNQGGILHDP